jgi:hypothetical protein
MIDSDRFGKLFFCCVIISTIIMASAVYNEDTRGIVIPHTDTIPLINGATQYSDVDFAYITTNGGVLYDFTTNSPPL